MRTELYCSLKHRGVCNNATIPAEASAPASEAPVASPSLQAPAPNARARGERGEIAADFFFQHRAARAASAGTELQLQFKRWAYEGNGAVTLMVAMRNPTAKPFATVVWSCDFYDKDHRVVGHSPLIFHVVPWGAVVVDTQYVYSNGMFQSGSCQLVGTEAVTRDNERLYRGGPQQLNLGNDNPMARAYFSFEQPIQGRAEAVSKEEEDELEHKRGLVSK